MAGLNADPRLRLRDLHARIAQTWAVSLSTTQIWELVRRHGGRQIVPRPQHYQADITAQKRFKKSASADTGGVQGAVPVALSR